MKLELYAVAGLLVLVPALGWSCACGCGVFDVRTRSLLPTTQEGMVYVEYNYMDQNRNWSGSSRAPDAGNSDKEIRTDYYTVGGQYMFSRQWGVLVEAPFASRYFKTTDDSGNRVESSHSAMGDVRLKGIYSGFSCDMSSGVTFGLKLPTGDYTYPHFDHDTQIGVGSTDVLLGMYLMGRLPVESRWGWFLTGELDQPALTEDNYKPGSEIDAVGGFYYDGWRMSKIKVSPVAQMIGSRHWRDRGSGGDFDNTGYDRLLASPGVEFTVAGFTLYTDIAFPLYQHVNGQQLVASELYTIRLSYSF